MASGTRALVLLACAATAVAADFQAGVARAAITPREPIRMFGYAARTTPSEGAVHDLWAKALAIQDRGGSRFVMVTFDLLIIPRTMADEIATRANQLYKLRRGEIALSASHTHAAPVIGEHPHMLPEAAAEAAVVRAYTRFVTDTAVRLIGAALQDMQPVELSVAHGAARFAVNRRQKTDRGYVIGVNPDGPTDPGVPVVVVQAPNGGIKALLFGYACHNTTLTGDFHQIAGDYAGFAQIELEKAHPGSTALFVALCAGDQNPNPRGTLAHAQQYGKELADAVTGALAAKRRTLHPPLRTVFVTAELPFAAHSREMFEERSRSEDPYVAKHARYMLGTYSAGKPIRSVTYPVQSVRFGDGFAMLLLGGEVVIDYALRAKREFAGEDLMVAAYSNDVMCYIPSLRVLKEGGYEADTSMLYYGMPGPFADSVEERVFAAIRRALARK